MKKIFLILATIALCILVACGGGGGGGSSIVSSVSNSVTNSVSLGGSVIDGYISGATVCLDVNSDNQCTSADNPYIVTSTANGSYTLPAYSGSLKGLQVIAIIPAGAIDSDTPNTPISVGYTLAAPALTSVNKPENTAITPLTTLAASTMVTSQGNKDGDQATAQIAASLGIPATNIAGYDYKKQNDSNISNIAKATANAIATSMDTLSKDSSISSNNISKTQITQSAIQHVRDDLMNQFVVNGKATDSVNNDPIKAQKDAENALPITGQIQNILVATKSGNGTVVSMADVLASGLVAADRSSGDYINAAGYRVNGNWSGYKNALEANLIQTDLTAPAPKINYVYVNSGWFSRFDNSENWTYDGQNWVLENPNFAAKPTVNQNCINNPISSAGAISQVFCAVQKDFSNQKVSDLIPSLCNNSSKSSCNSAVFPSNSFGYDFTSTISSTLTDSSYNGYFSLNVTNDNSWGGYCTAVNCPAGGNIYQFITQTQLSYQFMGNSCNTPFLITSYDSTSKTGVISWAKNPNGCSSGAFNYKISNFPTVETSQFSVITKGGKDILITPTPAIYRANNPGNNEPYRIFAPQTSSNNVAGIWNGTFMPVNYTQSIPFTGSIDSNTQLMNKATFDTILSALGFKAFPYSTTGSSSGTPNGKSTGASGSSN